MIAPSSPAGTSVATTRCYLTEPPLGSAVGFMQGAPQMAHAGHTLHLQISHAGALDTAVPCRRIVSQWPDARDRQQSRTSEQQPDLIM
jgi:hypothetical protein